ncbi:MT-A70-domain-containing protein [Mycena latifolia]|nr:MT-A70-domain-containing protein [Mycena latifolia]
MPSDAWIKILRPTLCRNRRADSPPAKRGRVGRYKNYVPEEEAIRNDYSQQYVDGGEWPQNWILGADPDHCFEECGPQQQRLLALKKASANTNAVAPSYLPFAELASLHPAKFEVILLDPPFSAYFTWVHLQELPVPALAADPSFTFMWVGSGTGEGLESGHEVFARWGYRRCEDVVWVRTNKTTNARTRPRARCSRALTRTKQHCLIGIRGTVRWEGDTADPTRKPPEMYTLIENFCLGTRRLEVFSRAHSSVRRGWVTALMPRMGGMRPMGTIANQHDFALPSTTIMTPRTFLFHHRPVLYVDSPLIDDPASWTPLISFSVVILATVEPQPVIPCHAADKVHNQMPANPVPPLQACKVLPHHQHPT